MRTLNVKRTVVLLVVVIVVAGSAHLLHSFQVQRNSSVFKQQAEIAWNATPPKAADALRMMRVYLTIEPLDTAAREELASWYLAAGDFSKAFSTMEEIIRGLEKQDPPDLPRLQGVRRKAADAALALGRPADAAYHLEILKQQLHDAGQDDVDVVTKLAKCQISLGHEEDAVKGFSEAIKLKPDRIETYFFKSGALLNPPLQRQAEAEKCMAEMIAYWVKGPGSKDPEKAAGAHCIYGKWLDELGKSDEALKQAEATLILKKDHPGGLYLAGKSELALADNSAAKPEDHAAKATDHLSRAEGYARRGIDAAPQDFTMYSLMADIQDRMSRREKAIEVLSSGVQTLQSGADKSQLLWHLANLYLDGDRRDPKNLAAALECVQKLRDFHYPPVQMAFLDARVLYAQENWKAALDGFEAVSPKLMEFPTLMKCLYCWIGYCHLQGGSPDEAMAAFRRSLSIDKFYFRAHDGIAQIFLGNDQIKDAVIEYRQAALGNPNDPTAWQAYARTLVQWNLRESPEDQNWGEVAGVLDQAQKLNPHDGQFQLLIYNILVARGREKEAAEWLKRLPSGSLMVLIEQANAEARKGNEDQARQILRDAKAKLGDLVVLRLADAAILLHQQGPQAAAAIDRLATDVDAFSSQDKIQLWNGLAGNFLDINEFERAKQLCRQIAREQPHDAIIRYRLVELALATFSARDPAPTLAEIDGLLAEIDAVAGQGPLWLYGKAVRLKLEAGQDKPELLDSALAFATKAQKLRLSWSRPHVLKGEIYRQRGEEENAIDEYMQASVNGERDAEFVRILLQMLNERQRYQEAEQVIHRLQSSQTPMNMDIGIVVATIDIAGGDFDRALASTNRAYNRDSDDYRHHVWFGQMMTSLARRAQQEGHLEALPEIKRKAEEALARACQLAPNTAAGYVALVQFLIATNQPDKARVAAKDAEEMIPLGQGRALALGYMYEAMGDLKRAAEYYEDALKVNPHQPRLICLLAQLELRGNHPERAAQLIAPLLSGELKAAENDLVTARRMQAVILFANAGYYPGLKKANELIDRNLASRLASLQDRRLKLQLLLADPDPHKAHSGDALHLAEQIVNNSGGDADAADRFTLAHLYLARGDWDRCRTEMDKIINGAQTNPGYLADYVRMLLEQDQMGDAELWLDKLEKLSPPDATVGLHAEFLYRRKKWAEIPDFLAAFIEQKSSAAKASDATVSDAKTLPDRMLRAAQIIEDLAARSNLPATQQVARDFFAKAREWYEGYVEKRPGGEMILAAFDARRGKLPAAVDLLTRFGGKASPIDLATAAAAVIRVEAITPAQMLEVEKILVSALAAQPQSLPLLGAMTELKVDQGRFTEAEDLCRQMIAKDPNNYHAFNNLSVLLALSGNHLDEALSLVEKAIELAGPRPKLIDSRAVVHLARNESKQALDDLETITADKPDPIALFHVARGLLQEGQTDGAIAALAQARNKGLDRAMIDPPERPLFDQLQQQVNKVDN